MATLELSIQEEVSVTPVTRTQRPGVLFWIAIGWIVCVFAVAILASLPLALGAGSFVHP